MSETHMDKAARETARELCEKATAGPWGIGRAPRGRVFVDGPSTNPSIPSPDVVCSPDLSDRFVEQDNDNMRFIAAARTLLPQALDALDVADADNARLQSRASALEGALASEREACAKLADKWIAEFGDVNPTYVSPQTWAVDAIKDISDAIRARSRRPAPPVGDR